jgi:hypothetical protein
MKTEEVLRREGEYRAVREALGTYHVDVVAMRSASVCQLPAEGAPAPGDTLHSPPAADAWGPTVVAPSCEEAPDASGAKAAGNSPSP